MEIDNEKYAELLARLVKFFEWRRCQCPDDLAQETLLRGLRNIRAGAEIRTSDPANYFFGIAHNVVNEDRRASFTAKARTPLAHDGEEVVTVDVLPSERVFTDQIDARLLLNHALGVLSKEDKSLFLRYHLSGREKLRLDCGLTAEALRLRIHRIRKKLMARLDGGRREP